MVSKAKYLPKKGDIVWINLNPQSGREQKGKRPALVLSSDDYNKSGLFFVCPITSKEKGYLFEVRFATEKISGVILADQIKSLDWKSRGVKFSCKVPKNALNKVREIIFSILLQ